MEEQQLNPLAVTHLLQYTLRSLCCQDNSQWVYAVFWRILPRNYPPPKWDAHGGAYDRSRGNRRNWILVWEDGYCNFAASSSSSSTAEINSDEYAAAAAANYGGNCTDQFQHFQGLQPELFFKMSHEIYNYGEGLIGKVAADHSHKWIYKEPNENQEINFLSAWHNSADAQPRTWEAQFQSGIKTIALIAVREGVVQLGAVHKVVEDLSYVVLLRKKFAYIESIPGVLLPHPSSAAFPATCRPIDAYGGMSTDMWAYALGGPMSMGPLTHTMDQYGYHDHFNSAQQQPMLRMITPSMSSLEALLSKLPSVIPDPAQHVPGGYCGSEAHQYDHVPSPINRSTALELMGSTSIAAQRAAKEEVDEEDDNNNHNNSHGNGNNQHAISNCNNEREVGECSGSMSTYHQQHFSYHHHQDLNITAIRPSTGF